MGRLLLFLFLTPLIFDGELMAETKYLTSPVCIECHQELHATFSDTMMGKIFLNAPRTRQEALGCEACHGPGMNHLIAIGANKEDKGIINFQNKSLESVSEYNAICLSCHQAGQRMHWRGSQHDSADLSCTSCHTIMKKVSPKRQFSKKSEIETCFQCHADKRAKLRRR